MELVSLGKEVLQNLAERASSHRLGQTVLRHLDRALWAVEKCARWAVPPPLDQDERPQMELVRPLPWVFFLMMLITLRVMRESISLLNLVMGKPPLRSADVVIFFQSKRRYLRTLKYQGNRLMRARTSSAPAREPWYNSIYKLFELTMCFRRESSYGNNNTTRVSNNDEVMVVKRSKRVQPENSSDAAATETTMERLIEKMMVDLDAESDEDSCYTLTNATSVKSDSESIPTIESDPDATLQPTPTKQNGSLTQNGDEELHFSPTNNVTSTPEKEDKHNNHIDSKKSLSETQSENTNENSSKEVKRELENNISGIPNYKSQIDKFRENLNFDSPNNSEYNSCEEAPSPAVKKALSTKQASENCILNEQSDQRTPKKEHKIANGRTVKSVPNKKKGPHRVKHNANANANEVPPARVLSSNNSF